MPKTSSEDKAEAYMWLQLVLCKESSCEVSGCLLQTSGDFGFEIRNVGFLGKTKFAQTVNIILDIICVRNICACEDFYIYS